MMDKDRLLQIFDYLNERLKANQLQLEITIYGETVMTMVYDNRPATKGIISIYDIMIILSRHIEKVVSLSHF